MVAVATAIMITAIAGLVATGAAGLTGFFVGRSRSNIPASGDVGGGLSWQTALVLAGAALGVGAIVF